ncbi:hypothetical protein C3L33_19179, partial [Rhododendron williamsianum]
MTTGFAPTTRRPSSSASLWPCLGNTKDYYLNNMGQMSYPLSLEIPSSGNVIFMVYCSSVIRKLEDKVHAQEVEMCNLKEQVAEMSTLKEQVAFMMRHMPEVTGLQVRDSCNGSLDQISPQAHQGSLHASHDIECSNGGYGPKPSSSISGQISQAQLIRDAEEARDEAAEAKRSCEEALMEAAQARKNTEQLAENMATMQSQLNFLMQLQNGRNMPSNDANCSTIDGDYTVDENTMY